MAPRLTLLILALLNWAILCFPQKPVIDTLALKSWKTVSTQVLSNDGKYFSYTTSTMYNRAEETLHIKSVHSDRQLKQVNNASAFSFTSNKKIAVYLQSQDSLVIINLENQKVKYIAGVDSYILSPDKKWIAYRVKDSDNALHLFQVIKNTERVIAGIKEFQFFNNENLLLTRKANNDETRELICYNLYSAKADTIWKGNGSGNFVFDKSLQQFAFIEDNKDGNKSIWFYHVGNDKAEQIVSNNIQLMGDSLKLTAINRFTKDGTDLFFSMREGMVEKNRQRKEMAKVDIWTYMDFKLQSQQLLDLKRPEDYDEALIMEYTGVVNIQDKATYIVKRKNQMGNFDSDDCVVVSEVNDQDEDLTESYWHKRRPHKYSLISVKTGQVVTELMFGPKGFSPDKSYTVFYDPKLRDYCSFNMLTRRVVNITASLPIPKIDTAYDDASRPIPGELGYSILWLKGNKILLRDRYDIWMLDPSGVKQPVNITNAYGRKNRISFEVINYTPVIEDSKLLLSAFNNLTKDAGFFSIDLKKRGDPMELTMGPYRYEWNFDETSRPLNDGKEYVLRRESALSAYNFFLTKNFTNFTALTDVHPEKEYNWMTSEVISWRSLDGYPLEGVIYKPENFDSAKKYPVIINYYEKLSHEANVFHLPDLSSNSINIPWFVSRGYIVVTPDIFYKIGMPGRSALSSVISVTNYLKKLNYIDRSKIGIQGHSFGGFETNYIVTHSNLFAAAVSASGLSDEVSHYGTLGPTDQTAQQYWAEVQQQRIGSTLWARPDLFIENSPIFEADKTTTPLLVMANKTDGRVPFNQGLEMFTALRRLGKKVWMLQYDDGEHSLNLPRDKWDYTLRMMQFFDHYLKDAPAPVWMTRGIPARDKGFDDGFQLDQEIKVPPFSPLIDSTLDPRQLYDYFF